MKKKRLARGKGIYADFTWLGDELKERFRELVLEEIAPVARNMEATAKRECPVGTIERLSPLYDRKRKKARTMGHKWESRQPGRLRDSIRSSVTIRKDRSAVLLFLEAGDHDAFYARFVEFGTARTSPHPFLRSAFNQHIPSFYQAILRSFERLGQSG